MKPTVFVLTAFLLGALAHDVPNEKVKAAFLDSLRQIKAAPHIIEGYEKAWDGSLPATIQELKPLLQRVGHTEHEIQIILEGMENVARNKDNPSWKTQYGNLFVETGGADKSVVEKLEQNAPDAIPHNINEAIDALKKAGLKEEHAQGHAKIALWLGKVPI